jgi:bifunctional DNA-binding transcriptional regulator/antitoxin component of YhaV-PrlF toxin-antitoxin module
MTTQEGVAHLILRRVTRQTLRLVIPAKYQRAHDLRAGDHVVWIEEEDGVKLKFVRLAELDKLAKSA